MEPTDQLLRSMGEQLRWSSSRSLSEPAHEMELHPEILPELEVRTVRRPAPRQTRVIAPRFSPVSLASALSACSCLLSVRHPLSTCTFKNSTEGDNPASSARAISKYNGMNLNQLKDAATENLLHAQCSP
jgi:hypothetical protein